MSAERQGFIPEDYIQQNQEHWRNARRASSTRPLELQKTADILHNRITKTFGIDSVTPILAWSVLFDNPLTPASQVLYAERFPEEIAEADRNDYSIGIGRITEYATNIATIDFLNRNSNLAIKPLAAIYASFGDLATYRVLLGGTYGRMEAIRSISEQQGKNYKEALFNGLFKHDFGQIDALIADTKEYSGYSSLNEAAIDIGKKRLKKPDIGKLLDKLEIEDEDNPKTKLIKNCALSVLAGGVFRTPGVTEISAGMLPVFFAETLGIYAIHGGFDIPTLALNLATVAVTATSVTPFATIHEMIHYYSASQDYMGFIPAQIIQKEGTPKLARLEKNPNTKITLQED